MQIDVRPELVAAEARVRWGKSSLYEGLEGLETPLLVTSDEEKLHKLLATLAEHPGLKGVTRLELRFPGQAVFPRPSRRALAHSDCPM